ncbi:24677_t:CDS:2, partial [Gigaspora rosea]
FRRPKPPEKKIETLHKKITNCTIRVAKNPSDEIASHKLESFRIQLKEELEKMDFYEKLYKTEEIDMAAVNKITSRSVKNGTVP